MCNKTLKKEASTKSTGRINISISISIHICNIYIYIYVCVFVFVSVCLANKMTYKKTFKINWLIFTKVANFK